MLIGWMLILSLFFFVSHAVYATSAETKSEKAKTESNTGLQFKDSGRTDTELPLKETSSPGAVIWMIIQILFALALIAVLIFIVIKFFARKSQNFDSPRKLRIIAGIGVSPQKSIQVVEVGRKLYILGVGQDVNLLDKIDNPDEVSDLVESLDFSRVEQQFIVTWKQRFQKWFKKKDDDDEDLDMEEYERMFQSQLIDAARRQGEADGWTEDNKERSE